MKTKNLDLLIEIVDDVATPEGLFSTSTEEMTEDEVLAFDMFWELDLDELDYVEIVTELEDRLGIQEIVIDGPDGNFAPFPPTVKDFLDLINASS